jgi:hypothetical protein
MIADRWLSRRGELCHRERVSGIDLNAVRNSGPCLLLGVHAAWTLAAELMRPSRPDFPAQGTRAATARNDIDRAVMALGLRGDLWADGVILLAGGLQEDIDAAKTGQASAALSDVRAMIERIATIYAIEERVRGTSADIRLAARQRESKQLMEELKTRLIEMLRNISAKSPLAEAINYRAPRKIATSANLCESDL